ncbi:hypothetical protein [Campylobacter anatolicus]|uniref:hypothetical protein n=1 Tax=Campylobacter anatolicus TaxID=2829105 RepID=UPI001BA79F66|nr:hypothetical protein [Campylobacter anatolicus]
MTYKSPSRFAMTISPLLASCVGELAHFIDYVRVAIDDGKEHEFIFENGDVFYGEFSECVEYANAKR